MSTLADIPLSLPDLLPPSPNPTPDPQSILLPHFPLSHDSNHSKHLRDGLLAFLLTSFEDEVLPQKFIQSQSHIKLKENQMSSRLKIFQKISPRHKKISKTSFPNMSSINYDEVVWLNQRMEIAASCLLLEGDHHKFSPATIALNASLNINFITKLLRVSTDLKIKTIHLSLKTEARVSKLFRFSFLYSFYCFFFCE